MRPWYRLCYETVGLQLRLLHRIKIEGREHVPQDGCLIVANHASYLDPTTIGWAVEREIFYLARKSLFRPPVGNWLLPICNVLPIDRDGGDMSGLRNIIKLMRGGEAVLLFPEGTRTPDGTLQPALPGAGLVAVKTGVPILPVRIFGTYEAYPRHRTWMRPLPLRVVIGTPYRPSLPEGKVHKQDFIAVAREMMDKIAALT